jgi:hypothetical protein
MNLNGNREGEGRMFIGNVGIYLSNYTASHTKDRNINIVNNLHDCLNTRKKERFQARVHSNSIAKSRHPNV